MPTPVFLTVDTELLWRHHVAGLPIAEIFDRSIDPAGVGVAHQLETLSRYSLRATFFVDPMPALLFGLDPIRRIVDPILDAGQDVQLHLHCNWTGATLGDRGMSYGKFELVEYGPSEQRDLIGGAAELLIATGAPPPVAFRAGSFGANDDTLAALADLGFRYDSSHCGSARPWPSTIGLSPLQIAPIRHAGMVEVPVTVIEDRPGAVRPFQICALSIGEMAAALDHAAAEEHGAVNIVSHSFELATRDGTRPHALHIRRFEALCALLADRRDMLPTKTFGEQPELALDRDDRPLGPSRMRTGWRQAQQLWSNMVRERAA